MHKTKLKYFIKNCFVALVLLGVHVLALFSSPTFLGSDYSRKTLIDTYCNNNINGSSIVFNASASNSAESVKQIFKYKDNNDNELNTILGLSTDSAEIDGTSCTLVSSTASKISKFYNSYRVYSDYNWNDINTSNNVFISDRMGMSLVPPGEDPKDYRTLVRNKTINIKINEINYSFKIAGFYDTFLNNGGWRSRGNYFSKTFSNCIFVNENFLKDKYTNVFQMFTSDSVESGETYRKYESLVNTINGKILTPKNTKEAEVLNKINALNKKTNVVMRVVAIAGTLVATIVSLVFSIRLFDLKDIFQKFRWTTIIWCLLYVMISYGFVFLIRGRFISVFGYNALGANKASLSIMSIYTFLLIVSLVVRFLWRRKKETNNKIVHYDL